MTAGSLQMIDAIAEHHRWPGPNRNVSRTMTRAVQQYLVLDNRLREKVAAEDIGDCVDSNQGTPSDLQGAYSVLKRWY